MNFPMIGGVPESAQVAAPDAPEAEQPAPQAAAAQQAAPVQPVTLAPAVQPAHPAASVALTSPMKGEADMMEKTQVIVYGRAGCQACMDAIQDLIDRQVSFIYKDVSRDAAAMQHLQSICGPAGPMVPVIVQIGFAGRT